MVWVATNEGDEGILNSRYRGATSSYLILTSGFTPTASSTAAQVIAAELLSSDGYSRQEFTPAAAVTTTNTVFPDSAYGFTNSGASQISYDNVALIYDGSPTANSIVASIASNTITSNAHGLSNNDLVIFTNSSASAPTGMTLSTTTSTQLYYVINAAANTFQISTTQGGGAVGLGTAFTGTLVARHANGVLDSYDPETGDIAIDPSQTSTVTVTGFGIA